MILKQLVEFSGLKIELVLGDEEGFVPGEEGEGRNDEKEKEEEGVLFH